MPQGAGPGGPFFLQTPGKAVKYRAVARYRSKCRAGDFRHPVFERRTPQHARGVAKLVKAADSDSAIRGFESFLPCQIFDCCRQNTKAVGLWVGAGSLYREST